MGRDIIETGFAEFLTESNKLLRPLFEARMFDMKRKPKKKKKKDKTEDDTAEEEDLSAVELDDDGYLNFQVPGVIMTTLEFVYQADTDMDNWLYRYIRRDIYLYI